MNNLEKTFQLNEKSIKMQEGIARTQRKLEFLKRELELVQHNCDHNLGIVENCCKLCGFRLI